MSTYLDLDGNVRSGTEYPNPDSYSPDWMSEYEAEINRRYPHADILSPGPNRSQQPQEDPLSVPVALWNALRFFYFPLAFAWIVWHFWPIIAAWVRR